MVTERETESIRKFVCEQFRDGTDLSTLTLGILKKRYLALVQRDSLSPEAKSFMKQVVVKELIKMQNNDENEIDLETKKPHNKRKRGKEKDESISGGEDEDESRAKKSRFRSSSSSESEEKKGSETGSEESEGDKQVKSESEDEEQGVTEPQRKTNGKRTQQLNSEDSSDEEMNKSENSGDETNHGNGSREMKEATAKNGETRSRKTSPEKKIQQSDEESESEKINDSSDNSGKENKASVEKENNNTDSDSSSLPSLEDEQSHHSGTEKAEDNHKKKRTMKKEEHSKTQKDDNKAVVRLKRYIALCGVRRNYKKLLDGCRSIRSQVAVLKKELEDLGVHGPPSIEKCKKARMKREEAQELAGLDVSNIISTQGRPKRRGASGWKEQRDTQSSPYQRTLNSSSENDEESDTHRGRKRATEWANLQGIISDDADSD